MEMAHHRLVKLLHAISDSFIRSAVPPKNRGDFLKVDLGAPTISAILPKKLVNLLKLKQFVNCLKPKLVICPNPFHHSLQSMSGVRMVAMSHNTEQPVVKNTRDAETLQHP